MQKISQVNVDTKLTIISELQICNALKDKEKINSKTNTNKDPAKRVRKNCQYSKGPTTSLSDTGLMDNFSSATTQNQSKLKKLHLFMSAKNNDKLEMNLSKSKKNFFLSVTPFNIEIDQNNLRNTYFELVQHEVNHLREKFEMNNRNYQMDDLIRLTDHSKKILSYGVTEKLTDYDEKGESIYYNQECRRVEIERKVGLGLFLKVYERMINIINDDFDSNLKYSLEYKSKNLKTLNFAGDSDDIIKNKWKQIIGILDEKQEYLPDIWELAMSENMFYHM